MKTSHKTGGKEETNNYKLIACDLDGTLIGSDLKLSKENCEAIKEITSKGVLFVPATGRTICEMEEIFNMQEIRYVIFSNGAVVYDKLTGDNIFLGLDEKNSSFIYDTASKFNMYMVVHKDGKTYADKKKSTMFSKYNVSREAENLVKKYCILHDDLEEVIRDRIECVSIFFASQEETDSCRDILSSNPDLHIVEGWECNLEIFFKNAGKDNALKRLAEKLNLDMKNVITFGDSDNDRQMTILSGLGLAVENACDLLKEAADKIICSNNESVVRYVIDHYFH